MSTVIIDQSPIIILVMHTPLSGLE